MHFTLFIRVENRNRVLKAKKIVTPMPHIQCAYSQESPYFPYAMRCLAAGLVLLISSFQSMVCIESHAGACRWMEIEQAKSHTAFASKSGGSMACIICMCWISDSS